MFLNDVLTVASSVKQGKFRNDVLSYDRYFLIEDILCVVYVCFIVNFHPIIAWFVVFAGKTFVTPN